MRLQDPDYTRILLVALAETTPVSQASALQDDLRRAGIEPYAWIINKSLLAAGTRDALVTKMRALFANVQRFYAGAALAHRVQLRSPLAS